MQVQVRGGLGLAFGPNAPYNPTWRKVYASSATRAAATPAGRPSPLAMNA